MKKFFALLLVLCTFLTALPATMASAAEPQKELKYEDLYVKDGLIIWLDAFHSQTTDLDLEAGTWKSKVGDAVATIYSDNSVDPEVYGWKLGKTRGFGRVQNGNENNGVLNFGVSLPTSYIPEKDFTAELVASFDGLTDDDGSRYKLTTDKARFGRYVGDLNAVGMFRDMGWLAHTIKAETGAEAPDTFGQRWFISPLPYNKHEGNDEFNDADGIMLGQGREIAQFPVGQANYMAFSMAYAENGESVTARVSYNNVLSYKKEAIASEIFTDGRKIFPNNNVKNSDDELRFQFMSHMPGSLYGIRVYNRALSTDELSQNHFADIVGYYGIEIPGYSELQPNIRKYVHQYFQDIHFDSHMRAVQKKFKASMEYAKQEQEKWEKEQAEKEQILNEFRNRPNYDEFYVQDGLTVWLDAFCSFPEINENLQLEKGIWKSKVGSTVGYIGGKGYWTRESGGQGIGYRMTMNDYFASLDKNGICPADIHFDASLLPPDNFTVETVATMVGLTDLNGERYIDGKDSPRVWGIYTADYSSFSFGPFKAMTFICESHASRGTPMGSRWCYTKQEWGEHNGNSGYQDENSLDQMDGKTPVSFTVSKRQKNSESDIYSVIVDGEIATALATPIIIEDPEPEFNLFKGLASTVYTVRVYDRLLSQEEMDQNHAADLLSYYGLSVDFYKMVLESLSDKHLIYESFRDMGFDLTKEEAAKMFNTRLTSAWLSSEGLSVRLDNQAAVRAVFRINEAGLKVLEENGFKVEVGILLNVGGTQYPTLEQNGYHIWVRNENGEKNSPFFLDEENGICAMAVNFISPTPLMSVTNLYYTGYVKMTDKDGNAKVLYNECYADDYEYNLFGGYNAVSREEAYKEDEFILSVVDNSFEKKEILLDSTNGDDANDGKDSAVKTLERAYELLLELLTGEAPVDVTLKFEAGKYVTEENIEFDALNVDQKYFRLHYLGVDPGEDGKDGSVITSNLQLDNSKFLPDGQHNYYVYQFDKDAKGKYPDFYLFYADGKMQEVARHGYNRTYEALQAQRQLTGDEYTADFSLMWKVPDYFVGVDSGHPKPAGEEYKLYLPREAFEGLDPEDFKQMEFHMPIAWYYRMIHIDRVDFAAETGEGNIPVYFDSKEMERVNKNGMHPYKGNYFWLQNSLAFVDEPGEFYYDRELGRLYYYPDEDVNMETSCFEIPQGSHLISFLNTSNLTFENMVFTGSDNKEYNRGHYSGGQATSATSDIYGGDRLSAVYLKNTRGVTFYNCVFHDIGANGLWTDGVTRDFTVDSCRFFNLGSSAINMGSHDGSWNETRNVNENLLVTNNYIDNVAIITRGSVGVYCGVAKNYTLSYNTIRNTSYSAVSLGWRWSPADWNLGEKWHLYNVELCNNFFENFMTDQSDGGAIYTLGGNVSNDYHEYFNSLHDNFAVFSDACWDGKGMVMPYYHDGGSSNWHTHSNVEFLNPYYHVHTTIYLQNILDQLTHNILVEGNQIVAAYQDMFQYMEGEELTPEELEYAIFGQDGNRRRPDDWGKFKYYSRVDGTRDLYQQDNTVYKSPDYLEDFAISMAENTGSEFYYPDVYEILDELSPIYEQYYLKLEADYEEFMQSGEPRP